VTNGEGVCVSFFVQGCPHHCSGCFNPETWDFNGGKLYNENVKWQIIKAISANGIERNFSILGGEPLAPQNIKMVEEIVTAVRIAYPNIKIFLWTGYEFENLDFDNKSYYNILSNIDVIIDGKFIEEQKDLSLKLRGSSNQNIWIKENNIWRKDNG
jgi:anaerobic ribonucleoside-triphosphate reductase activating protein